LLLLLEDGADYPYFTYENVVFICADGSFGSTIGTI
jgi:hypothetical protein